MSLSSTLGYFRVLGVIDSNIVSKFSITQHIHWLYGLRTDPPGFFANSSISATSTVYLYTQLKNVQSFSIEITPVVVYWKPSAMADLQLSNRISWSSFS